MLAWPQMAFRRTFVLGPLSRADRPSWHPTAAPTCSSQRRQANAYLSTVARIATCDLIAAGVCGFSGEQRFLVCPITGRNSIRKRVGASPGRVSASTCKGSWPRTVILPRTVLCAIMRTRNEGNHAERFLSLDEPFPTYTGIRIIMTTLRIRGLYAAALTILFRQREQEWEIVQPHRPGTGESAGRLAGGFTGRSHRRPTWSARHARHPSAVGNGRCHRSRSGRAAAAFKDIIIRRSGMQVGSMYLEWSAWSAANGANPLCTLAASCQAPFRWVRTNAGRILAPAFRFASKPWELAPKDAHS